MTAHTSMDQALRFQIDPQAGESARACTAIARSAVSMTRGNLLMLGLYAAVGLASYFLTPATRLTTFIIGIGAAMGMTYGLQAQGRSRLRRLLASDPHSAETHFVEISDGGLRAWCAHVDARYPWADFTKVVENDEFYMFVRPNGTGSAIPKR